MSGTHFLRGAAALVGLLFSVGTASGQTTGAILGTVTDDQGGILPGATVTVTSEALAVGTLATTADATGDFRFPNLPPGDYVLRVELSGFGTYIEEGMVVLLGGTVERAVSLGLAAVAETVTVTGESPVVDTRRSGVSTNFSNEYMENTPLRRFSFFDFTKSAPGMSATNPTSGTSSRVSAFGSGVDENRYLMDGVDFTAPVSGAAWPWPDTDVIEEMEIVSLGASAEYGSAAGAVFNVVTKQGTNEYRADGAYFGMFDRLTSKPVRVNADGEMDSDGWGFTRNKYIDATAHVGGPIIRDRAWIYGGYQYLQDWDNQPGTNPEHPREFGAHRAFWKVTADITPNVKFMHTYHNDWWVIPSTPSVSRPFEAAWTFSGNNPAVTFGRITHILSDSTFYELALSGFYSPRDVSRPNNPGVPRRNDIDNGIASGGAPSFDIFKQGRTEVKAKVSHYASDWMGGDHDFKFGVSYVIGNHSSHGGYTPGPNYPSGVVYYDNGDGSPNYISLGSNYNVGGEFRELGVFAEDVLNIGNRATISAGLRFDRVRGISPDLDNLVATDIADMQFEAQGAAPGAGELYEWTNWGPRVGFNIKLDEDGRTVLRGNFGRFYRAAITGEMSDVHPGQGNSQEWYWNAETGMYDIEGPKYEADTNFGFDPNGRSPRTDQFSIGFDRELSAGFAFGFSYVRKDQNDMLGWNTDNASYGRVSWTAKDGQAYDVFPILSDPDDRYFRLSNVTCEGVSYYCEPLYMDYNGLVFILNKRMADRWQAQVSYVLSRAYGLLPSSGFGAASSQTTRVYGSSLAKDPNQFTNATGHLLNDRTHTFRVTGAIVIPGDVLFGFNYALFNGKPWGVRDRVPKDVLPQGGTNIYLSSPGSRRLEVQNLLDLRISRAFYFGERGKIEPLVDILNIFNSTATEDLGSQAFGSSLFGVGERWIDPRRAFVGVKFAF